MVIAVLLSLGFAAGYVFAAMIRQFREELYGLDVLSSDEPKYCAPVVKCACKPTVAKCVRVGREMWKPGQSVKLKAGVGPTMQLGRLYDNNTVEVLVALGDVVLTQTLPVAALRRLDDLEELVGHATEGKDGQVHGGTGTDVAGADQRDSGVQGDDVRERR